MTWVEDALRKSKELTNRDILIRTGAEGVFRALWNEIQQRIQEIKEKGKDNPFLKEVFENGDSRNRTILLPQMAQSQPKELHIEFRQNPPSIEVYGYSQRSLTFSFTVDTGNQVVLREGSKEIPIPEAARMILEPFFFPELEPLSRT